MSRAGQDEYVSTGGGSLKLKGVKASKISKNKKRKHKKPFSSEIDEQSEPAIPTKDSLSHGDGQLQLSNVLQPVPDEGKEDYQDNPGTLERQRSQDIQATQAEETNSKMGLTRDTAKTAAELRHEERRRKMLSDRLKREGTRTHKERVEELNKYLSGLSEHHDMPRIGPG